MPATPALRSFSSLLRGSRLYSRTTSSESDRLAAGERGRRKPTWTNTPAISSRPGFEARRHVFMSGSPQPVASVCYIAAGLWCLSGFELQISASPGTNEKEQRRYYRSYGHFIDQERHLPRIRRITAEVCYHLRTASHEPDRRAMFRYWSSQRGHMVQNEAGSSTPTGSAIFLLE